MEAVTSFTMNKHMSVFDSCYSQNCSSSSIILMFLIECNFLQTLLHDMTSSVLLNLNSTTHVYLVTVYFFNKIVKINLLVAGRVSKSSFPLSLKLVMNVSNSYFRLFFKTLISR